MFAVDLLDALAEAAVFLLFDMAPTGPGGSDGEADGGAVRVASVSSWSSFDSCGLVHAAADPARPPSQSPSPSVGSGSFAQLTVEDLQLPPHGEGERVSGSSSTLSVWTVPMGPLSRIASQLPSDSTPRSDK